MNYGIALSCAQHMASTQLAALGFVNSEVLSLIEDLIALTAPVEEGADDAADQPV